MNFSPWTICSNKLVCLSLLISPHRKEMGEIVFWSFFKGIGGDAPWVIQGWWKLEAWGCEHPHWTKTLSVCTRLTSVFSFKTLYRINLERLFVCFVLIFILWDHHTIFYIWECYWKYGLKYLACFYYIGKRDV